MSDAINEGFDQFMNTLTEKEREDFLGHKFSCCTLNDAKIIQPPFQQENLFDVISGMKRYVVDTNSNWKAESANPQNRDKAFIITNTVTDEQNNLAGLLFSSKVNVSNHNLFIIGIIAADWADGGPAILIEKLDTHYRG